MKKTIRILLAFFIITIICSLSGTAQPCSAAVAGNPCFATLDGNLSIHIPSMFYEDSSFALDLAYRETGPVSAPAVWFELTGIENSSLSDCTNPATLFFDSAAYLLVHIPVLTFDSTNLWATLEFYPTNDGKAWLKIRDFGLMPNQIFVTSERGTANLSSWASAGGETGLAAGDAICRARAEAAGLQGNFVALLSNKDTDFYCRLHGLSGKKADNCGQAELPVAAGPWVRTDGFPFAPEASQLFAKGVVYAPVICDEFGNRLPDETRYWSCTSRFGAFISYHEKTCSNWSNDTSDQDYPYGGTGISTGTTSYWTDFTHQHCGNAGALLCMQTGIGAPLPDFAMPAKTVFLTSVSGNGDLSSWPDAGGYKGLAAGDAICRARAQAAGLPNAQNFKAWLSDSSVDARDRLVSDGPWKRIDGVIVARNKADLTDGKLSTAISQDEAGKYWGNTGTWTGTGENGLKTENTCSDWSADSDAFNAATGNSSLTIPWSDYYQGQCDASYRRLLCFED